MKKLLVVAAMVLSLGTSAVVASNKVESSVKAQVAMQENEFTKIEVSDLPQAVQDAIKANYEGQTIKEAYMKTNEDKTKIYKVVLVNAENIESHVLFNENGEVIPEKE